MGNFVQGFRFELDSVIVWSSGAILLPLGVALRHTQASHLANTTLKSTSATHWRYEALRMRLLNATSFYFVLAVLIVIAGILTLAWARHNPPSSYVRTPVEEAFNKKDSKVCPKCRLRVWHGSEWI